MSKDKALLLALLATPAIPLLTGLYAGSVPDTLKALLVGLLLVGIYFLPWFIALSRRHRSAGGIAAVNLFLGWTFLGWVIALAWASSYPGDRQVRL